MGMMITINDENYHQFVDDTHTDDEHGVRAKGLIQRDLSVNPKGSMRASIPFPKHLLLPRSKWQSTLDKRIAQKSQLSDIRNRGMFGKPIPSRDQNGKGYCWAHSGVSCLLLLRALQNQPYADLSAYSVAATIKKYRDEGGFGAQGLEFIAERGCATSATWPQRSMDRSLAKSEKVWADAANYKFDTWLDVEGAGEDKVDMFVSLLLWGVPLISDFNWWSHSVSTMELAAILSLKPLKLRSKIWNSWGDKWSDNGTGYLEGGKAIPDDFTAPYIPSIMGRAA